MTGITLSQTIERVRACHGLTDEIAGETRRHRAGVGIAAAVRLLERVDTEHHTARGREHLLARAHRDLDYALGNVTDAESAPEELVYGLREAQQFVVALNGGETPLSASARREVTGP